MQPTYEGLKPRICGASFRATKSLQPTYEGLKPFLEMAGLSFNECLQPTYEGLKPPSLMRLFARTRRFAAYLRGIETLVEGRME